MSIIIPIDSKSVTTYISVVVVVVFVVAVVVCVYVYVHVYVYVYTYMCVCFCVYMCCICVYVSLCLLSSGHKTVFFIYFTSCHDFNLLIIVSSISNTQDLSKYQKKFPKF